MAEHPQRAAAPISSRTFRRRARAAELRQCSTGEARSIAGASVVHPSSSALTRGSAPPQDHLATCTPPSLVDDQQREHRPPLSVLNKESMVHHSVSWIRYYFPHLGSSRSLWPSLHPASAPAADPFAQVNVSDPHPHLLHPCTPYLFKKQQAQHCEGYRGREGRSWQHRGR